MRTIPAVITRRRGVRMSNCLRRLKRQMKPHYSCCGRKMTFKEWGGVYVCEVCGKAKKVKAGVENE